VESSIKKLRKALAKKWAEIEFGKKKIKDWQIKGAPK
jgi:hypothetical protein